MTSCGMSMPCDPVSSVVWPESETANDGEFRKLMIRLEIAHVSEIEQLQHQNRLLRSETKSSGALFTPAEHAGEGRRLQPESQAVGGTPRTPITGATCGLATPRVSKQPQIQWDPKAQPVPVDSLDHDGGASVGELESRDSVESPRPLCAELQGVTEQGTSFGRRLSPGGQKAGRHSWTSLATGKDSNLGTVSSLMFSEAPTPTTFSDARTGQTGQTGPLVKISTHSSSFEHAVSGEDEAKRKRATGQSFNSKPTKDIAQVFKSGSPICSRRELLRSIVNSSVFEAFFSLVILTNCIFLGIVADFRAMYPDDEDCLPFKIVEYCYTGLFAAELVSRILGDGLSAYCDSEKMHWYFLDTFVVVTSLCEVALEAVQRNGQGMSFSGTRVFRVIRIIRIIKVIRVARVVKFVRALRTLVLSIMHTMRSVVWAFVLLLAIIYVFGLIFVQVVTEHAQSHIVAPNDPLMVFWGTLPRSMFTLYKSIASGISWHEVVQPLADIENSLVALFVLFISFTVFAVLNVITGVFCEAAIEGARQDNEMMVQQHLAEKEQFTAAIYSLFGVEGQGDEVSLTYAEFICRLADPKTKAHLAAIELDVNDAWELFRLLDTDDSAIIDVEEFVVGCLRLKGFAKAIDLAKLDYESKMRAKKMYKLMGMIDRRVSTLINQMSPVQSLVQSLSNNQPSTQSFSHERLSGQLLPHRMQSLSNNQPSTLSLSHERLSGQSLPHKILSQA